MAYVTNQFAHIIRMLKIKELHICMYHIFLFITYGRYEVTYFVIIQFANDQENCQIIVSPEIDRLVMLMWTNLKNVGLMKSLLDATQFGSKSKKLSKGLAFRKGHHQFWWKKWNSVFWRRGLTLIFWGLQSESFWWTSAKNCDLDA